MTNIQLRRSGAREGWWQLARQKLFFALLFIATIISGGCSSSSGSQQLFPQQQSASGIKSTADFTVRSHAMQFTAIALPKRFRPVAIMKDGTIPGAIGDHAAVFSHGRLRVLKDYPGCTVGARNPRFTNTATSVNMHGEVVGYCDYQSASQSGATVFVAIPLYYKNGKVKALPYQQDDPMLGSIIFSMSINDLGIIVGDINVPGEHLSGLYRFYTDGTQATAFGSTLNLGTYIETINDKNVVAHTVSGPDCGCHAAITSITGQATVLFPGDGDDQCSLSAWINDRNDVVGAYANGCAASQAYVYSGGVVTYLPAPATEATGINNAGDIIGAETSGLFLYKNGTLNSISSDITPRRNYGVITNFTGFGSSYLGGLSKYDEFIAIARGKFYLVGLSGCEETTAKKP